MPRKPLEQRLKEYDGDPVALYKAEHLGVSRARLQRRDSSLYNRLSRDGLLKHVRTVKHEIWPDALAQYKQCYKGVTRHQLKKDCPGLHRRLREEGLLHHVPLADRSEVERGKAPWGYEPLKFYRKHYNGLTRGELEKVDSGLATRLRNDGLMRFIPKKDPSMVAKQKSKYGLDPLAYYWENYSEYSRGQLSAVCVGLYNRLRKEGLIDQVPLKEGRKPNSKPKKRARKKSKKARKKTKKS